MSKLKLIKKFGITMLALMTTGSVLAGCGNSSTATSAKGGVKEISIMTANSPDKIYWSKLGDEFTKLHPNIKVKVIQAPQDQFDSKLQTMIASKTEPDITTHVASMSYKDFYTQGLLLDLTPYITKYGYDPKKYGIPDTAMKMSQVDDKTYGIPLNLYSTVLLYNKDLFDKAKIPYPTTDYEDQTWTYDKMIEISKKLTIPSKNPTESQYGLVWNWDGGGTIIQDPDYFGHSAFPSEETTTGFTTKNNFNTPEVTQDIQTLADQTFKDKVSPPPAFLQGLSAGSDPFLSGKIAMTVEGAWALSGTNDVSFKVGVAAVPIGPNPKIRDILYTDPYFIFKDSKNPDEAFQFIQFMSEEQSQEKMVEYSGGNPPSNINANEKYYSFFKSIDPKDMKSVIEGGMKYSTEDIEHLIVGSAEIHTLVTNELAPVFDGSKQAKDVTPGLSKKLNDMLTQINSKK
jgi:multiple sugar transport system substrate-binding protein